MKKIAFACTIFAIVSCRTADDSEIQATKSNKNSPEAICAVKKIAYDKMAFGLRDLVTKGTQESLTKVIYSFALKTTVNLDSELAEQLTASSGAVRVNEIAGNIGTGRGTLCAIVKLVNNKQVSVVEGAKPLGPVGTMGVGN